MPLDRVHSANHHDTTLNHLIESHRRGRIASARDDGISFVGADAIRPYERNPTPSLFVYPLIG